MQRPYRHPNGNTHKCGLLLVLGVISTDVNAISSHLFPRVYGLMLLIVKRY